MPDLKWLDEVLPDNDKWQQWRVNLVEFKDNIKNNIEIGKSQKLFINRKKRKKKLLSLISIYVIIN